MNLEKLRLYSFLSRLPYPKSYLGKIMLVAFLGTHVPLLALIFYFVLSSPLEPAASIKILAVALVATLLGTGFTLYSLYSLLVPISVTSDMLHNYISDKKFPGLPTGFHDQAGKLMADVQYTVKHLEDIIESLKKTSMTDYLTGVYNRHAGEARLKEDLGRTMRDKSMMSLVVLDIDNFKQINDQYGHEVGDMCLKEVANIINKNIRQGDWLSRWGGDEFVLALFHAREKSSTMILERIYAAIKEISIHASTGEKVNLSVSAGICPFNGQDDSDTLFDKADQALYQAKREGRKRISTYKESVLSQIRNVKL